MLHYFRLSSRFSLDMLIEGLILIVALSRLPANHIDSTIWNRLNINAGKLAEKLADESLMYGIERISPQEVQGTAKMLKYLEHLPKRASDSRLISTLQYSQRNASVHNGLETLIKGSIGAN